jgi:hypothetical protein
VVNCMENVSGELLFGHGCWLIDADDIVHVYICVCQGGVVDLCMALGCGAWRG